MPLISVIMPVYNAEPYLREAIDSILGQTIKDFEFLIVNDGSTDKSEEIILSYNDARIVYIKNTQNSGLIFTLNKAIELARGTYIARMDNDDISEPNRFEIQLQHFQHEENIAMVCSPIIGITSSGKIRDHWQVDFNTKTSSKIAQMLPWQNCISHPTILIRADVLKSYKYSIKQKGSEDWDLWLRLARDKHKIVKTEEVLLRYRIHAQSITRLHNQSQSSQIKAIIVKFKFFIASLFSARLNIFVIKTLFTVYKDLGYYLKKNVLPKALRKLKWSFTINPVKAYRQYRRLKDKFKDYTSEYFLFFPYAHIGGAEKVHAEITKLLASKNPFVFITGLDNHSQYPAQFGDKAHLLEVAKCLYHPLFSNRATKLILDKINSVKHPILFGSNNIFFYDLLMQIPDKVYAVDLTHDYDYKSNEEKAVFYLSSYLRCHQRIFISNDTLQRTQTFYRKNFVENEYFERLKLVYNCVEPVNVKRNRVWDEPFKIIYVGRDTPEKRVDLIFELAANCAKQKLPFEFNLIGAIKKRPKYEALNNLKLVGLLKDANEISIHYAGSHFVLITSRSEGFPLTLMEGMMHGCIPISTDVGDIPNHLVNGQTGFMVSSLNSDTVVHQLLDVLNRISTGDVDLEKISENAVQYALLKFDQQIFRDAYSKLLNLK